MPYLESDKRSWHDSVGWRDIGVGSSAYAVGDDWPAWTGQPAADAVAAARLGETERVEVQAADQLLMWLRDTRRRMSSAA